jgi:ABC-type amino acid transport substrate-binding protein
MAIDASFSLMIKRMSIILAAFLIAILPSCSSWVPKKVVTIGIDPAFFSSPVGNKQGLVYAYVVELFEEIFTKTRYKVQFVELSFDNLLENVDDGSVDCIITSLLPSITTQKYYNFSDMFISLGDVFVTRSDMPFNLKKFSGKIIAVQQHPNIIPLFADYPAVNLTYYSQIPETLVKITNYSVDGALVPYLSLASTLSTEYKYFLKVDTSKFYTDTGLRLLTLKNSRRYRTLIPSFNKHLKTLSSHRDQLLSKWNLTL